MTGKERALVRVGLQHDSQVWGIPIGAFWTPYTGGCVCLRIGKGKVPARGAGPSSRVP